MTWKPSEIRSARQAHLKPILENLGYRLKPLNNGNYEVCGLPRTVVIKRNYWICTETQTAGNVIDFCTKVLNMSFRQTMEVIMESEKI